MNQNQMIKERLAALSEPEFQKFQCRLLPGVENILGVRLPALRKIAQELAKGSWQTYLSSAADDSFEEIMLQGMTIGYVKEELPQVLPYINGFIPKISNWSVCDSFCSGLKITKSAPSSMLEYLLSCLDSEEEYRIRFGVVMLLIYYIKDEYLDLILSRLDSVRHSSYYVKMSVAWAVSMCFVAFPAQTMDYLKQNQLDDDTYHKTLRKITESLKVDGETKKLIRQMRR